ncbi:MAG: hypothetical protein HZB43_04955 [candidate division Zixibacteria bacterium]|nr:hypothetical protein [candidate division Zixibacteria bacterium]
MAENAFQKIGQVNLILVTLLGILIGGIGGYMVGVRGPIAVTADPGVAPPDPFALSAADEYIIQGFSCPAPACQDPLLTCHCEIANGVKTSVKEELQLGKDGSVVREELIAKYGPQLRKSM